MKGIERLKRKQSFDSFIILGTDKNAGITYANKCIIALLSSFGNTFLIEGDELINLVLQSSSEEIMLWDGKEIPCSFLDFYDLTKSKYYLDINSRHILFKKTVFKEFIDNGGVEKEKIIEELIKYIKDNYSEEYEDRELSVLADGGKYYKLKEIGENDLKWLSKDFDVICFEGTSDSDGRYVDIFSNEYYQKKLSPKQMLDVVRNDANIDSFSNLCIESRLKYLETDAYKIYENLGDSLVGKNDNQAFLCYENAEFLCDDNEIIKLISQKKHQLLKEKNIRVNKAAFIILSYNNIYLMQRCIESIYTNCNPESYRLIIFDNNSTDGVAQWLADWGEVHDEAIIVLNDDNLGFSGGCNAAIQYADDSDDIFLLNNDTRVPANALFWLRMALYSSDEIGATGSVQNYFNNSRDENVNYAVVEKYMEYGANVNTIANSPLEEQSKLCGFAMLIRREVWNRTGGFDERFNPGYLEDDDISLNIRSLGYKMLMVHNSFIYHAGSQSFIKRDDVDELNIEHRKLIIEKWGFDSAIYAAIDKKQLEFIDSLKEKGYERNSAFKVLHIGCGCGNMLGHIHYLYPNAELIGVEENDVIRKFAISCLNIYDSLENLPYALELFDEVYSDYMPKNFKLSIKNEIQNSLKAGNYDAAYDFISKNITTESEKLKNDPEYCVIAATALMYGGDYSNAFEIIKMGLLKDNHNYELYVALGEYYALKNIYQELICFEQALFYCDEVNDRAEISGYIREITDLGFSIDNLSIVIVLGKCTEKLQQCISSIFSTLLGNYEVVIVSEEDDEKIKKLPRDVRAKVIIDKRGKGYFGKCNTGIKACNNNNNILLLDSDAVLMDNAFFYLMMGLYSDEKNGIISGLTNEYADEQSIYVAKNDLVSVKIYADNINVPMKNAVEQAVYVSDFAMLIRRSTLDKIGIFDESFMSTPYGYKDFCVRANKEGIRVVRCFNSFILKNEDKYAHLFNGKSDKEKDLILKKWKCDIDYCNKPRIELIDMIKKDEKNHFKVLELGCAMGSTLNAIKRKWNNVDIYGIEYDSNVVRIGSGTTNIIQGDVENMVIPFEKHQFDYIICADVLEHLRSPEETLKRFMPYLKDDGYFLISVPNIRFYGIIEMLSIYGRFDYADSGILDKTHLRFFTKETAREMIENAGLKVIEIKKKYNGTFEENDFVKKMNSEFGAIDSDEMYVFQYYFSARKI